MECVKITNKKLHLWSMNLPCLAPSDLVSVFCLVSAAECCPFFPLSLPLEFSLLLFFFGFVFFSSSPSLPLLLPTSILDSLLGVSVPAAAGPMEAFFPAGLAEEDSPWVSGSLSLSESLVSCFGTSSWKDNPVRLERIRNMASDCRKVKHCWIMSGALSLFALK